MNYQESNTVEPKRIIFFCTCLFILSAVLSAYSSRNPEFAKVGSNFVSSFLFPLQKFNSKSFVSIRGVWGKYIALVNVKEENSTLKEKINHLTTLNSKFEELRHENTRLKDILNIVNEHSFQGFTANVIAFGPTKWIQEITIDKGEESGVKVGMTVIEGNGLVGLVVHTNTYSSQILLISDPNSGVDAFIQSNRVRGIVEGIGAYMTRWSYVPNAEKVSVGERVISSGLDGVFPKGLFLGVVQSVQSQEEGMLFQEVRVEPSVDFKSLESVFVVTGKGNK